jgi:lysophospholipid acyltransferase
VIAPDYFNIKYLVSEEFKALSLIEQYFWVLFIGRLYEHKFIGAFQLQDVFLTASGLSYSGKNEEGEHEWYTVKGIYTYEILFSTNMTEFARYWNHQTHDWLRYYVYTRLVPKGQKPTAL